MKPFALWRRSCLLRIVLAALLVPVSLVQAQINSPATTIKNGIQNEVPKWQKSQEPPRKPDSFLLCLLW